MKSIVITITRVAGIIKSTVEKTDTEKSSTVDRKSIIDSRKMKKMEKKMSKNEKGCDILKCYS